MSDARLPSATLLRRLAALLYESLLVAAVLLITVLLPQAALGALAGILLPGRAVALHCFLTLLAYFVWFWMHGGQTLATKTWRIRLVDASGGKPRLGQAVLRFLAAWFSVPLGIGILWALVDGDRQFLHDRIAGTRLVTAN